MFIDGVCNPGPPLSYCRLTAVSFEKDLPFRAALVCNRLVSGTFDPPSGVLFSFPSPYWYAIGLEVYLVLAIGDRQFRAPKPGYATRDSSSTPSDLCLRGFHPLWQAISGHFCLISEEEAGSITLHLPQVSMRDSVWTFPRSLAASKGIPIGFFSSAY